MDSFEEKLSRVAALRPRSRVPGLSTDARIASNSEQLIQLVEGESRVNRLGAHIHVRRRFPQPRVREMSSRALQLLASGPVDPLCDSGQWLFLDTETTGLAGGTGTYAFLVGVAWWEEDGFAVEQFFMRDHSEESSLLLEVLDRLAQRRILVTFNGKSFDWPLLQTRYQMARIGAVPEPLAHLDLLHPARRLWRLQLQSVALAQLEQHILRLDRGQDIPSETIPQRYFDFLRGGHPGAMAEVFRHNQLDLCGLASLALHMTDVLADPENSGCGAGEFFGISRLLQKRGEARLAELTYQKALDSGLPRAAEQVARRELALLAKRGRNFELSNALWGKLLDDAAEGLRAYEQLAIYYEHHASLPQKAAALSREALIRLQEAFLAGRMPSHKYQQWHGRFQHRLDRLAGKMESSEVRSQNSE
jgi:uncharacterized protein YprB with RNaseH-like and TPR domain